jgi:serine phosphatase RsbU (regulator of sigma subunit)
MPYKKNSLQMMPGDSIFLYTDGVTEAENVSHGLYGEDRLQKCLDKMYTAEPQLVLDRVSWDMKQHVKEAEQFDDITMLCLKRAEGTES